MSETGSLFSRIRREWRKPRLVFPPFEGRDRPINRERLTQMVLATQDHPPLCRIHFGERTCTCGMDE